MVTFTNLRKEGLLHQGLLWSNSSLIHFQQNFPVLVFISLFLEIIHLYNKV